MTLLLAVQITQVLARYSVEYKENLEVVTHPIPVQVVLEDNTWQK